jgi:hypothetical protein
MKNRDGFYLNLAEQPDCALQRNISEVLCSHDLEAQGNNDAGRESEDNSINDRTGTVRFFPIRDPGATSLLLTSTVNTRLLFDLSFRLDLLFFLLRCVLTYPSSLLCISQI